MDQPSPSAEAAVAVGNGPDPRPWWALLLLNLKGIIKQFLDRPIPVVLLIILTPAAQLVSSARPD